MVTRGGLVYITVGGNSRYAIDTRTRSVGWEFDLGTRANSNPMSYRTRAGTHFVGVATGSGANTTLRAFALPQARR